MNNEKCTCGAVKTYGKETTLHSDYCDSLKPPEPKEEPSKYPWDDEGGSWIMMGADCELTIEKIFKTYAKVQENAAIDRAMYGTSIISINPDGTIINVNPFDIDNPDDS